MPFPSLTDYLSNGLLNLKPGPVALLLMEDLSETNSTIRHHLALGFDNVVVLGPRQLHISAEFRSKVQHVVVNLAKKGAFEAALNPLIDALVGHWIYYGYNAEYLFYPFSESRSVGEVTAFATEERRDSILTYVIDLYASDLAQHPNGVSLETAHLDKSGYYADTRWRGGKVMERQLDMFGGLRWRFEEHIAPSRRKIDRIGLFRAQMGLEVRADHTFNVEEYNTYACPWHHSLTAAICSFRAAKALKTNPGSSEGLNTFHWHNSQEFSWTSQQLLDLGLMEPGQWF